MNSVRMLFGTAILLVALGASSALGQAGGGTVTGPGPGTKPVSKETIRTPTTSPSKKPEKTTPRATSNTAPKTKASGPLDRIDGKWWTVGNGFGDSELVLTQNGASISGELRFADGRTGSLTGTLVGKRLQHSWTNSTGDGGTGWLELSWANFLGGAWRNQRVKDGSWALRRIEGKWCLGGSRSRVRTVTHNERGQLFVVTEDGTEEQGRLQGPSIFLDSDQLTIEGEMFYKGNRIDWSSGAYWTWCGR